MELTEAERALFAQMKRTADLWDKHAPWQSHSKARVLGDQMAADVRALLDCIEREGQR
jgi:hypothetical protein